MKYKEQKSNGKIICDVHMEAQEKERQRIRQSNLVMLTASTDGLSATQPVLNDNVTICCPSCQEAKEVDMNVFWKLDSPNRLLKINCASVSCLKRRTRVGKWLRRVRDVSVTVEQWLKHNGVYKSVDMKSAAVTKDQFMAQDDMNGKNSNVENTPAKRQSPIVNNDSAKKQRLDTQAVREGASATAVQTESNLSNASDDQVALSAKT